MAIVVYCPVGKMNGPAAFLSGRSSCISSLPREFANQAKRVAVIDPARRSRWSARASKRSARCNISFRASENRHDLAD